MPVVETIRAFIAMNPGNELIATLDALQRRLDTIFPPRAVRWVHPQHIHLTLKFLGNVSTQRLDALRDALTRACAGTEPFELHAADVGCFPSHARPRVIWVGLNGEPATLRALRELQKRIDAATQEFSAHTESREWQPHLTIGRVGNARGRELRKIAGALKVEKFVMLGQWPVRSVELMQSTLSPRGAIYSCLTSVVL